MLLAVDPGLNGAFVLLDKQQVIALDHLPTHRTQHGRAAKVRNELDLHALRDMLKMQTCISAAFLERVSAMPKQGVSSTFRFGESSGQLYGLLVGLGVPVTYVRPQQWQRFHGIGGAPDAARQRAVQLFPSLSAALSRKMDCQRADALLLGVFGLSYMEGHRDDTNTANPERARGYAVGGTESPA